MVRQGKVQQNGICGAPSEIFGSRLSGWELQEGLRIEKLGRASQEKRRADEESVLSKERKGRLETAVKRTSGSGCRKRVRSIRDPKGLLAFDGSWSKGTCGSSSLQFQAQFPALVKPGRLNSPVSCVVCCNRSTRQRASINRCASVVSREGRGWRGRDRMASDGEGKASRRSEGVKSREKRRRGW